MTNKKENVKTWIPNNGLMILHICKECNAEFTPKYPSDEPEMRYISKELNIENISLNISSIHDSLTKKWEIENLCKTCRLKLFGCKVGKGE